MNDPLPRPLYLVSQKKYILSVSKVGTPTPTSYMTSFKNVLQDFLNSLAILLDCVFKGGRCLWFLLVLGS